MLAVLFSGVVASYPVHRVSKTQKAYVVTRARGMTDGGIELTANLTAFSKASAEVMRTLRPGDSVQVQGPASLAVWEDEHGGAHPTLRIRVENVTTLDDSSHAHRAEREKKRMAAVLPVDDAEMPE